MRLLIASILVAAFVAACASPSPPEDAEDTPAGAPVGLNDVTVAGTVTAIDLDPWTYDGDAVLELATEDGPATVRIPARTNLCDAVGLATVGDLLVGDAVEVRGARGADGAVTPCVSAEHRLVRDGETAAAVHRGLVEIGFEA